MPSITTRRVGLGARLNRLADRLALRMSHSRCIDGLWIGCWVSDEKKSSLALDRVEQALSLIKLHDPLRYQRLRHDFERIWVNLLFGNWGEFRSTLKICVLDERFVLGEATRSEQIAATIVHEATHARLIRCGIGYEAALRARVEAICFRRERAFAARLPDSEIMRDEAERRLSGYPRDYWTDEALRDRHERESAEALRYIGAPELLIRLGIRLLRRRSRRGVTRGDLGCR